MTRLLADVGGPFYDTTKPFRNWSALPFYQIDLPHPPFVDMAQLTCGVERARDYLVQIAAQGYTGIVVDNLPHLVTFDCAPQRIYATDDPCRLRALAYCAAFGELFAAAAAHNMEVFVATDMQWATPAVRRYVGELSAENPRLAEVNRWAIEELFARFPQVSGVFVRVGEAGGAHDQGREYTGHMIYRRAAELRALIDTLLPLCEQHDRLLVLRTWSIGIGELGDLMWSPERYRAVFGGYTSPQLLVSIKHGPSDFFRHMPRNPTLGLPGPAQIIELQNRREYELFGMVPSSVAELHQEALRDFLAAPGAAGVWAWNSSGGWGGGSAALGEQGWSLWTELSSALTAALARTPDLDTGVFVHCWCADTFADAAFAAAVAAVYTESAALIEQGWYGGPLDGGRAALGGLYLPPLLWVWWMRPTAAPLIWAYLAAATPDVAQCLEAGRTALQHLDMHTAQLAALAPIGDKQALQAAESVCYLRDCIGAAQAIRSVLLPAFVAARSGDRHGWNAATAAAPGALAQLRAHRQQWGGRADFPALELDEIERFLRDMGSGSWALARAMSVFVGVLLRNGTSGRTLRSFGLAAIVVAFAGALASGRGGVALAGGVLGLLVAGRLREPALRRALPWLSKRYFLLPTIFFETGPAFTEWTG